MHLTPVEAGTTYTASVGETAEAFRQRAQMEAARYGSDPWVFVRELLQNARDAGAGEVRFRTERSGGLDRVVCRDDGEGMSFDHARRFLFTLYATSKAGDERAAGRFGIGFWSVLRFHPSRITVRSRPRGDDGWEVAVDGALRSARQRTLVMQPGTEIVLERPETSDDLAALIGAAVQSEIRFLMCRDDPATAVRIMVNDQVVSLDREPPPPALRVSEPGLTVTVALAETPKVEVFAHGIRVRSVSFLGELLAESGTTGPAMVELPGGLLPQVVLDSTRLQVLLARGDARLDRTMVGLVRRAERELSHLIRSELDRIASRPPAARLGDWIRGHSRSAKWGALAAAVAVTALAGVVLQRSGDPLPAGEPQSEVVVARDDQPATAVDEPKAPIRVGPYRDLAGAYSGPRVDALAAPAAVDLRYRPETAAPLFSVIRVAGLDDEGRRSRADDRRIVGPYRGRVCTEACLAVDLEIAGGPGPVAIPVASGHRIDPDTVLLDGASVQLVELASGQPAVRLDAPTSGMLSYVSGEGPAPVLEPKWSELPAGLRDAAAELVRLAPSERASVGTQLVASAVRYDRTDETARRLERERPAAGGFLAAAVAVGAGDCDVQNAVLAALLSRSGLPAWLVVGFVGVDGRAQPGLHAWVEYHDGETWHVVDASAAGGWQVTDGPVGPGPVAPESETVGDGSLGVDPAPIAEPEPRRPGWWRFAWWVGGGLAALVLAAALAILRRRTEVRAASTDGSADLTGLLRSALLRPEAFQGVASLLNRPLVPIVGGRRMSLHTVASRAEVGRLFRSVGGTALARRAAARGEAVIDGARPEGAVVADLLGARDLDRWDGLADRAVTSPAVDRAADALRRLDRSWHIWASDGAQRPVSTIEGRLLGLGRRTRVVAVDTSCALWAAVEAALPGRPAWAALVLAEGVADRLDLDQAVRARWLTELARTAVMEGREGAP